MPTLINRFAFVRMRRLFELLIFILFVIILLSIGSKWTSTTISSQLQPRINPFLPIDPGLNQENVNKFIEKSLHAQSNLVKYIHLDLKGAPPQSTKFYDGFFSFINQLQMGVKGFLIEYEDMLPLQGRFSNVRKRHILFSEEISRLNLDDKSICL